jgi:hypothetical protein
VSRLPRGVVVLAALMALCSSHAQGPPSDSNQSPYPRPVDWKIQLFDTNHHNAGALYVHITTDRGGSCLGSFGRNAVLVRVDRKLELSRGFFVSSTPVAKFENDRVSIDLTGGDCDNYVLLEGTLSRDGGAFGTATSFGISFSKPLGTFVATVL